MMSHARQFATDSRILTLLVLLALMFPKPLKAQYMYMDSNGNGVHDFGDAMAPIGIPITVDVWLNTTRNRDGTIAECASGDPSSTLDIWNSYAVHINTLNGTVSYSGYINRVPNFTISCPGPLSNSVEFATCRATGTPVSSGGLVRLFTITVVPLTGTPFLQFVVTNGLDNNPTCFGSACGGIDFDNTIKLGSDWFDADGLPGDCGGNCPPSLKPVTDMSLNEGATATQMLSATDPEGDPLQFQKMSGPNFMAVTTSDPLGAGLITLAPGYSDAGSNISASVRVFDGSSFSNTRSFLITVYPVNRAPQAEPGGPYTGVPNAPIAFDGTSSQDPDGDALTYIWNFGDSKLATGPTPAHFYSSAGSYVVVLSVSDGRLSNSAGTIATITQVFPARAFTTKANRLLRLNSGKPYWAIQIEPIGNSFAIGEVDAGTIKMKCDGTGSVSEVSAVLGKTTLQGDADGNGVSDIGATFAKSDLQALFSNLNGSSTVTVTLEGNVTSGGIFRAQADIGVQAGGGNAVAVLPNPLHRSGEVSFTVEKPGRVRVALFDVSGRLVRVLDDRVVTGKGPYVSTIDGRTGDGASLASGIYYVRVSTEESVVARRVTILK